MRDWVRNLNDRITCYLTPFDDEELAEVIDKLVTTEQTLAAIRVMQQRQYLALVAERRLTLAAAQTIERLQNELMCARMELHANQGEK